MLNIDMQKGWFSKYGSDLTIGYCREVRQFRNAKPGYYIRNMHYAYKTPSNQFYISLLKDGKEVTPEVNCTQSKFTMTYQDVVCEFTFKDTGCMVFRLQGENAALKLDRAVDYDSIYGYMAKYNDMDYCVVNMTSNMLKYITTCQNGEFKLLQEWDGCDAQSLSLLYSTQENKVCQGFLEEVVSEWENPHYCDFDFDALVQQNKDNFNEFLSKMPMVREEFMPQRMQAAHILWSAYVKKHGILKRDAMYMSKNWMNSIWSWDHCFNALALSHNMKEESIDQFMLLFDFQHETTGAIPDLANDLYYFYNFCKPPIHGLAFKEILDRNEIDSAELLDIYNHLAKWTMWWVNYRDTDNDGIYEYRHGNDCGWDNSTVFLELPPIESPDLQTFMITQCDVLAEIATKLNLTDDAKKWQDRSDYLLERMLELSIKDNLPIARQSGTEKIVESDSTLLFMPLLIADKLPKEIVSAMVNKLKNGNYITEFGIATEPTTSKYFDPDGYWRGPIWGSEMYFITKGLIKAGEKELALDLIDRFSHLCQKSGFAENYNALTGEGLRDLAFTWTSSAFLEMENFLYKETNCVGADA
ncbi:MAG: hypothetical protein RSE93_04795 [Oscillospiraceae bacterium]